MYRGYRCGLGFGQAQNDLVFRTFAKASAADDPQEIIEDVLSLPRRKYAEDELDGYLVPLHLRVPRDVPADVLVNLGQIRTHKGVHLDHVVGCPRAAACLANLEQSWFKKHLEVSPFFRLWGFTAAKKSPLM